MPFYEAVWENGEHSVMECADDAEAVSAVMEHHNRALAGEPGGPAGNPANRAKRLLKYSSHPGDFGADGTLSKDEVRELLKDFGDVVNVDELIAKLRESVNALDHSGGPHDSSYKMPEDSEVPLEV